MPLPIAPTGVTATATANKVLLVWTAVSGATSYNIYRATISGQEGSVPVYTGITSNSYLDVSVVNLTTYYYTITALNGSGEGPQSTEVSGTPAYTSYNTGNNFKSVLPFLPNLIITPLKSPEFDQFSELITAYYQWLELPGNVLDQLNSLDSIADSSIGGQDPDWYPYFAAENLPLYPTNVLVNKRTLLNNIVNEYLSKGTAASLQFLFKILYNVPVTITYAAPGVTTFNLVEDTLIVATSPLSDSPVSLIPYASYNLLLVMATGQGNYSDGEIVTQSNGFTARVISWNSITRELLLNGMFEGQQVLVKTFNVTNPLTGTSSHATWLFGSKYSKPIMIDSGDGNLIAQFTYFINSSLDPSVYSAVVKATVHPAGTNFIGIVT